MARTDGKREKQHYVPQMLLRNFAANPDAARAKKQVYVLDKTNSRVFQANIRNVAAAYEFYEVETAVEKLNAEHLLSELEEKASVILSKLTETCSVANMSREDKEWLAVFIAVQFMRTETVRGRFDAINAEIEVHIRKMGYDPANVEGYRRLGPDEVKEKTIRLLAAALKEYPPFLLSKQWFLLGTPEGRPFHIGDHPVTMTNNRDSGAYGNLGLAVPGVQIYMPLSPSLTLALWCPTILKEIEANWREPRKLLTQLKALQQAGHSFDSAALANIAGVEAGMALSDHITSAAATGGMHVGDADNTDMLNSLQVKFASRFVMSNQSQFEIAERMFADNAAYRTRQMEGVKIG